jgi:hypothetical protein
MVSYESQILEMPAEYAVIIIIRTVDVILKRDCFPISSA